MSDFIIEPESQVKNNESLSAPTLVNTEGVHTKLLRVTLTLTVLLIITVIVTLLYLNGKSLYDHGL